MSLDARPSRGDWHPLAQRIQSVDQATAALLGRLSLPTLRVVLGVVFVWFGLLKLTGDSPVSELIARTLPLMADTGVVVPLLGLVEAALGTLLVIGLLLRVVLPALAMHLGGTFLTFLMAPDLMFHSGNPLLLTASGEFVVKNLVLIAATLTLLANLRRRALDRTPPA